MIKANVIEAIATYTRQSAGCKQFPTKVGDN